jgi:RNA polymerase sigma-70 factor (ECF subfamily)
MTDDQINARLSQIPTAWSVLQRAHAGPTDAAQAAKELLVLRYGKAVRRYLEAALRDPHAAADVAQEFNLALLQGAFHQAAPERGRFRSYIKTVLFRLVARYRKGEQKHPRPLQGDGADLDVLATATEKEERVFDEAWRDELLTRTWTALADVSKAWYDVLHFRAAHPDMPSTEMAQQLSGELGRPLTPEGVRQLLHRAREKFADLLVDEVAHSLDQPTLDRVEEELEELGLLDYCRPILQRRQSS